LTPPCSQQAADNKNDRFQARYNEQVLVFCGVFSPRVLFEHLLPLTIEVVGWCVRNAVVTINLDRQWRRRRRRTG